jgi:hypothetical protein
MVGASLPRRREGDTPEFGSPDIVQRDQGGAGDQELILPEEVQPENGVQASLEGGGLGDGTRLIGGNGARVRAKGSQVQEAHFATHGPQGRHATGRREGWRGTQGGEGGERDLLGEFPGNGFYQLQGTHLTGEKKKASTGCRENIW